jgi:hypothetical protein
VSPRVTLGALGDAGVVLGITMVVGEDSNPIPWALIDLTTNV